MIKIGLLLPKLS